MIKIGNSWDNILIREFESNYFKRIKDFLISEYRTKKIFPNKEDIFNALKYTDYKKCKVVILGQDPYHRENQAHGLAFSVKKDVKIPPSLRNIYKELNNDLNLSIPNHGHLEKWCHEGVLLLNTVLTVREGEPNSHSNIGWEIFTDSIIKHLNKREDRIIFLLWGNNAKSKKKYIDESRHFVLESVHPSPLSANRGFFGCGHFKKTNDILSSINLTPIDWSIKDI